jgi:hypothetical protein
LRKGGKPLLLHPTGLTWHRRLGTFLGDTVKGKAVIYRLDWERALQDGNLDRAVRDVISDDAAVNGYGDVRPEVRLYDPEKLLTAKRSSAPGVVAHRFLCGPFNQNLHWDADSGRLTCIQNVIAGRGWRLDVLDLAAAVKDGRAWGTGVRARTLTFPTRSELEGYRPLADGRSLFVVASRGSNVVLARVKAPALAKRGKDSGPSP